MRRRATCADWIRRNTPRAALLAPLAGLALAYLCLGFIFGVFQQAAIALLPMLILFTLYGSHLKLPYRLPPGLLAIGVGAVLVAVLRWMHIYTVPMPALPEVTLYLPHAVNIFALFKQREFWPYLAIIVPLAALDTLASLMILESVKVAGDDYATKPSLLMNGVGTIAAACLGSPFPTTLYLGHAAHKANGARSAYSVLNGLVTLALCTTGILPVVLRFVPLEVAAPVIIWFGLITVGQAVTEVPSNQAIAVVMGLIPALSQWATGIADTVARKAGSSLMELAPRMGGDLAMSHLLDIGHERVAYVSGPASIRQVVDRHEGALRAVRRVGLTPEDLMVIETDALNVSAGQLAGRSIAAMPASSTLLVIVIARLPVQPPRG